MSIKKEVSHSTESYIDVRDAYDSDIAKVLLSLSSGDSVQHHHYLNLAIDTLKSIGFIASKDRKAQLELIRMMFYLEDNNLMETRTEWFEGQYAENPGFFGKFYAPGVDPEDLDIVKDAPRSFVQTQILDPVKDAPDSYPVNPFDILDIEIERAADRLRAARDRQIEETIAELTRKLLNTDTVQKTDVVVALSENKVLKQMLGALFAMLKVEIITTNIDYTSVAVRGHRHAFDPNKQYSLEQYKNGLQAAIAIIEQFHEAARENTASKQALVQSEASKKQVAFEHANTRSDLEKAQRELEILRKKPLVEQATPIRYRIAWDDEDDERVFLGTSDPDAITEDGVYRVSSLIKTTSKREAIQFTDRNLLKKQLENAIKWYSRIRRDQHISLVHLKSAYAVTLLEYAEKPTPTTKILKSL